MNKQTTNTVLMIEPLHFSFNREMTQYNSLQQHSDLSSEKLSELVREEINSLAMALKSKGIKVILIQDDEFQQTPSSVFPSSWISFHEDSRIVAYPLSAQNRKSERRGEILNIVESNGFPIYDIVDISASENEGKFLHGSESVVFDRKNKIVYAAIAPTTNITVVEKLASKFGYFVVSFNAAIMQQEKEMQVSTNQLLMLADNYALVCLDAIKNPEERDFLRKALVDSGKQLIEVTSEQAKHFVCCGIQLESVNGKKLLVMSRQAHTSLQESQLKELRALNELLIVDLPVTEQVGGASVSSIISGVFLPK